MTRSPADQDLADLEGILDAARRLSLSPDVYVRGGMARIVAIVTATLRNAGTGFTERALTWEGPQLPVPMETVDSNPAIEKGLGTS